MRRKLVLTGTLVWSVLVLAGCGSDSDTVTATTTTVSFGASVSSDGASSGVGDYQPGVCPYPMKAVPDGDSGNSVVYPKTMSEWQPTLRDAAVQAAAPCFDDDAKIYYRLIPSGTTAYASRPAVSDGSTCFTFGSEKNMDRWRVGGQARRCVPFDSDDDPTG